MSRLFCVRAGVGGPNLKSSRDNYRASTNRPVIEPAVPVDRLLEAQALDFGPDRTGARQLDHLHELGKRAPAREHDRALERKRTRRHAQRSTAPTGVAGVAA